jgi:hypothetical protein
MAPISRKRRQPQADLETTSLLGQNGLDQHSRKKRKISHTHARTTAVEDDHVVESHVGPSSRTRITFRLRHGRHQPLEGTERTMCGVSELQCSRPGTMDQDDAFRKEAIRQDWLRRLRPRPTRAACGVEANLD